MWPNSRTLEEQRINRLIESLSLINIRRMAQIQTRCELRGCAAGPSIQTWRTGGLWTPDCVPDSGCILPQDGPEPRPGSGPEPEPGPGCGAHTHRTMRDAWWEIKLQERRQKHISDRHIWDQRSSDFSVFTKSDSAMRQFKVLKLYSYPRRFQIKDYSSCMYQQLVESTCLTTASGRNPHSYSLNWDKLK